MNHPMPTMRFAGRPIEPAGLALDRGVALILQSFEASQGDFPIEPGSERADRLVPPAAAEHYLRQGERVADAIMAVHGFFRCAMSRLHRADDSTRGATAAR